VDWLAATEAARRSGRPFEFLFGRYRLQRDLAVGFAHEALRAAAELSRFPAPLVRIAEHQGNDFNGIVHGRFSPSAA
jgi:hypothetical protein